MDGRTIVWIAYGAVVGWMLRRWYEQEKQYLMWAVKEEAAMAAFRACDVPREPPSAPPEAAAS